MTRLHDKVVLITGGGAGIGFGYARRCLAEGARVVVSDVVDPAPAAARLGYPNRVLAHRADVSDVAAVRDLARAAAARFGRIDVLVNNAAIFAALTPRPFEEIPDAEWDRVMAVNVRGVWNAVRAVTPIMRTQGSGRIVNVASAIVAKGTAMLLHYVASKGAVVAMTRALARESCARALKRDAYPEDVVGAVVFLASDASAFMSGQTLIVDGGSVFSTL